MKLRNFILSISFVIMVSLTAIFSVEVTRILREGFERLNHTYTQNVRNVVFSIISVKTEYLRNFARILERNYDLSGLYVLSKETGDLELVREQLTNIQTRGRFDFIDILTPEGKSLMNEEISLTPGLIAQVLERGKGITALETRNDLALIALAPLNLYNDTVGYVILGYNLNRAVAAEITGMTNASVAFALPETDQPSIDHLSVLGLKGQPVTVSIKVQSSFLQDMSQTIRENIFIFGAICFVALAGLLYLLLHFGFTRRFARLLNHIELSANRLEAGELPATTSEKHPIKEMKLLSKAFNKFSESLATYDRVSREKSLLAAESQKQAALAELAQDVAHNIRSPLSALDMFMLAQKDLPEESRVFIRGAIRRVHDVANHLLERGREAESAAEAVIDTYPLVGLVDSLVSEKRIQFRSRPGVEITFSPGAAPYGLFVSLQESEFKTVLSNLVNNAVESLPEAGGEVAMKIELTNDDKILVAISDTGRGIPEDHLAQLGIRRATFGKVGGSGLGLSHAKDRIEAWGGALHIRSCVGTGTCVDVILPRATPPAWFIATLPLPIEGTVVVLDDDVAIHRIWAERFDSVGAKARGVHLVHFFMADELRAWRSEGGQSELFLCDYELGPDHTNGLDVVRELGIGPSTVLVTGRYEDRAVREACLELAVKLLPKPLAPYIPLTLANAGPRA